jgi:hypothetical protein
LEKQVIRGTALAERLFRLDRAQRPGADTRQANPGVANARAGIVELHPRGRTYQGRIHFPKPVFEIRRCSARRRRWKDDLRQNFTLPQIHLPEVEDELLNRNGP